MTHSSPARSWPLLNLSKSLICTLIPYFIDTGGVFIISSTVLHSRRSERGLFCLRSCPVTLERSPIRSHTTEPRVTLVHFSFYKRLWCMGSPCYICLQFLFHARTHITWVICLLMIRLLDIPLQTFFSKSKAFASSSHQVCSSITWHDATFATIHQCCTLITHNSFHK